ncbi:hypothetical protein B0H13DRAFT_2325763 [Mycena leptocephala]|nr:hypothetical protein B0H13DRAFT_2325763 [Mycena leptocephala]
MTAILVFPRVFVAKRHADAARFREALGNGPRLRKLSMDGAGSRVEERDLNLVAPVELPHLHIPVMSYFLREYAIFLFSRSTASNVNDLTFINLCGDDYLPLFLQLTSAFPKVRLLTTYSIQLDVKPDGQEAMRRWFDSMPLLTYLRVANVAPQFFGMFVPTILELPFPPSSPSWTPS